MLSILSPAALAATPQVLLSPAATGAV